MKRKATSDSTNLMKLRERLETDDADELQRLVWLWAFRMNTLDDALLRWAVEHYDLYDPACTTERYRWPRRGAARLEYFRAAWAERDWDSPKHRESIVGFQRDQWNENVTDAPWPTELEDLARSRPVASLLNDAAATSQCGVAPE